MRQSVAGQKAPFASTVIALQSVGAGCISGARGGIQTLILIWEAQREEVKLEPQGGLQREPT